ncbi:MAG: PilN domain-containing protein [Pseudomonadota bacterium]|uniref:PilN domain-containing protein n=1 Tax=Gallaecimonas pentaromativorans TaxID=584787 RepID=UPI00067EFE6F|nr:PilN domain-containing protein [Gallaecimonas pentaromativorans]MED5526789.1 PilN domain-containing protein [Pseudomonadota bacterium]
MIDSLPGRLGPFWQWWSSEMLSLLPAGWRPAQSGLTISLSHGALRFDKLAEPLTLPLGEAATLEHQQRLAPYQRKRSLLLLPPDWVLKKNLQLPLATAGQLHQVLAMEMNRHTPFSAEQVYFAAQEVEAKPALDKLQLTLWVVNKAQLAPVLAQLADHGIQPRWLGLAGSPGRIPLGQGQSHYRAWLWPILLLAAALGGWAYYLDHRLATLDASLVAPKAQAEQAQQLSQRIEALSQGQDFLVTKRNRQPSPLLLLREVTQTLPDNTWINRLEFQPARISLQGESANASALISLLEASPHFANVRFSSPVSINPRSQQERFSLEAALNNGDRP